MVDQSPNPERRDTAAPVEPVADGLGWALGTVMRAYLKAAEDAVAYFPGGPRGYQVLEVAAALATGGVRPNQATIADRLGMDRTVMTHLLDSLEKQQLIKRKPDPSDRRSRHVSLTAKGRKTLSSLSTRVRAAERSVLPDFTAAEVAQFNALLSRAAEAAAAGGPATSACELAARSAEAAELA